MTSGGPLDRTVPPAAGAIRPFHLPEVSSETLPNGLRIRSMLGGSVPLVSARLVLDAGETRAPRGKEGVAVLTGDALQGGTRRRSGAELAEALERLGSGLRVSTGWDATTIAFTCVAERLDEMLDLLSEVARKPSFPADEFERTRREQLASIRQRRMDPGRLADDELSRRVFSPEHPYHRSLVGTESSVAPLDREQAAALASAAYTPAGGGLVLVGDLSPDRVLRLADEGFGTWTAAGGAPPAVPGAAERERRSVAIVHRAGAVQSEIRVGQPGPPRGHPDEIVLRVANVVLGGAFTSRLNLSLREEHGFTYGARSGFHFRRDGGAFSIRTAVQTEVTARALEETMAVLGEFAAEGPLPDELARARDYLAGVFPLRMETTGQLAGGLAELIIFGLDDDYHHRYRERIRRVDIESAGAAVRTHLRPDRAAIVIVGDADRIAPEVEALGLGEVEVAEP